MPRTPTRVAAACATPIPATRSCSLSYDPFTGSSPYSGPGPDLRARAPLHTRSPGDGIPDQLTRRLLAVRAYDKRHMLVDSDVTDGTELVAVAERLLDTPGAVYAARAQRAPGLLRRPHRPLSPAGRLRRSAGGGTRLRKR